MIAPHGNSPKPIRRQTRFYYQFNGQHLTILPPNSTMTSCTIIVTITIPRKRGFLQILLKILNSPSSSNLAFNWLNICMNTKALNTIENNLVYSVILPLEVYSSPPNSILVDEGLIDVFNHTDFLKSDAILLSGLEQVFLSNFSGDI